MQPVGYICLNHSYEIRVWKKLFLNSFMASEPTHKHIKWLNRPLAILWLQLKVVSFFYTRNDLSKEENQNLARIKFYELDLILRYIVFSDKQKIRRKTKQLGGELHNLFNSKTNLGRKTYTFIHIISQLS